MNATELIARLRTAFLDDGISSEELWSDAVLYQTISEVVRQANLRASLLSGKTTLAATTGNPLYPFPAADVRTIKHITDTSPTNVLTLEKRSLFYLLDRQFNLADTGVPIWYILDDEEQPGVPQIRLYPVPDRDITYDFRYLRHAAAVDQANTSLQIPVQYHELLIPGCMWICYQYRDEDVINAKTDIFTLEAMFTANFGPLPDAAWIRHQEQHYHLEVRPE